MDWLAAAQAAAAAEAPMPCSVIPDKVPGRLLSLDGDYLAYFMAGNDDTDPGTARRNSINRIEVMKDMTGCIGVVMHLSATGCTKADRFLIATVLGYQEQRAGSAKPKNWGYLREFFESYRGPLFTPKIWGDREADDGMAYMQQKYLSMGLPQNIVTATRDKDMRQYSGWHMDWLTYQMTFVPQGCYDLIGSNDLQYGHKWFWLQTLQGDTADRIPGLPAYVSGPGRQAKVGEVTAGKLLAECKNDAEACAKVLELYTGFYGEYAAPIRLTEQMLLLWLRRDKDASYCDMLMWLELTSEQRVLLSRAVLGHVDRVQKMKDEVALIETHNLAT